MREIDQKRLMVLMQSTRYTRPTLKKFVLFRQIFEKCSNIKRRENLSSGSWIVPCGQTDGWTDLMDLIVFFRSFAKANCKGLKYAFF
jgi:hypothetical protein